MRINDSEGAVRHWQAPEAVDAVRPARRGRGGPHGPGRILGRHGGRHEAGEGRAAATFIAGVDERDGGVRRDAPKVVGDLTLLLGRHGRKVVAVGLARILHVNVEQDAGGVARVKEDIGRPGPAAPDSHEVHGGRGRALHGRDVRRVRIAAVELLKRDPVGAASKYVSSVHLEAQSRVARARDARERRRRRVVRSDEREAAEGDPALRSNRDARRGRGEARVDRIKPPPERDCVWPPQRRSADGDG